MPTAFKRAVVVLFIASAATPAVAQIPSQTLADVRSKIMGSHPVKAVTQEGRKLHIIMAARSVNDDVYITLLKTACRYLGANAKLLGEIAVLNEFGRQGYVYEKPAQCEAVLKGAEQNPKIAILGATHAFF